jgi:hypothetical protein
MSGQRFLRTLVFQLSGEADQANIAAQVEDIHAFLEDSEAIGVLDRNDVLSWRRLVAEAQRRDDPPASGHDPEAVWVALNDALDAAARASVEPIDPPALAAAQAALQTTKRLGLLPEAQWQHAWEK